MVNPDLGCFLTSIMCGPQIKAAPRRNGAEHESGQHLLIEGLVALVEDSKVQEAKMKKGKEDYIKATGYEPPKYETFSKGTDPMNLENFDLNDPPLR